MCFLKHDWNSLYANYAYCPQSDIDLQVLENQLADVRSALTKETQEIGCLIDTFAAGTFWETQNFSLVLSMYVPVCIKLHLFDAAMENFPLLMESMSSHFEECDRKVRYLKLHL